MAEESRSVSGVQCILKILHLNGAYVAVLTVVYGLLGALIVMALLWLPQPYKMISIIKLGLVPALAVIAVVGAIRGPIAGFVSGFVGTFMYDLVIRGTIVTMGLTAASYGILGFVVGLASYSFENGRSLLKLSILSAVGLVLAVLVIVLTGLTVEGYATLVAIAYVLLPLLTTGLPSVLFLTPLFARLWFEFVKRFIPSALNR
ncbi:MAG: ECF transporter S component [Candidatus Thorarchaeota archaeon]